MIRELRWLTISLFLVAATPFPGQPVTPQFTPPTDFQMVLSAPAVQLFKKDYSNGTPDYVQVVDLSQGAAVRVLHGAVQKPGIGEGVYGGDNPRFARRSLAQYWQELSGTNSNAFCVTNGQFFYMSEDPPPLPFPLKVNGVVLSDGYGIKEFPDQKLLLEVWDDHVNIRKLTREALYTSTAPDIIGGLTEEANKRAKKAVARTFVGVDDRDRNGSAEILLVFNTSTALQKDAAEVLRDFGADQVMMLDGGGSTQLLCQGQDIILSDRPVPQALGVVAGKSPTPVATSKALSPAPSRTPTLQATPVPQATDLPAPVLTPIGTPTPLYSQVDGFFGYNILWIPALILPIAALLLIAILRDRR
jgi:hypothetical protein